jgi:predicted MFS family arabinose efflux permease
LPLAALAVAEVVSTTGTEMAAVALPWFVLVTSGSPARMGVVMAAEFAGIALCGIPSGRAATALGPRRTMLVSDAVRAPLIGLIPALSWAGALSFPVLLVIAFAVGGFFPAYQSSQNLLLAGLVDDDEVRLTRVQGLFGAVNETASFVGPALGGLLVALIGAGQVLLADAASFLAAFGLVAVFVAARPSRSDQSEEEEEDAGLFAGLRYLVRERTILGRAAGIAVVEIGFTALLATLPVAALHSYGGGARLAGWLLASFGAGSVAGGLVSARARTAGDRMATIALAGLAVSTWPLVAPLPAWGAAVAIAANGVCAGLFFPRFFSALTVRTPPALRVRVMTTVTSVMSAAGPLGFAGAGLLLQYAPSVTAGFALVAVATTAGAAIALSAGRRPSHRAVDAP